MDKGIHKYIYPLIFMDPPFSPLWKQVKLFIYIYIYIYIILIFLKAINSLKYIKERNIKNIFCITTKHPVSKQDHSLY